MQDHSKATLYGLLAIALWSAIVGVIRGVSEQFGATGGAALIYTASSVLLLIRPGFPDIRQFPRAYLYWGSLLFVCYELCLSLSVGYASNSRQAIEVGMLNYLWPAFTLLGAVLVNGQRCKPLLLVPGLLLALLGVAWVLGGEQGLDATAMWANVQDNPLSYGLAFTGALLWAAYCTLTTRIAQGNNGITLFFMLTALTLWAKFVLGDEPALQFNSTGALYLLGAAVAMGGGYGLWNIGILRGNVTLLAGASYFIPVFSALLSSVLLSTRLPLAFWQGAALVCGGSLLCWLATRRR